MILTGAEASLVAKFLSLPGRDFVLRARGKRYGGFSCAAHAEWFARRTGLADAVIEELPIPPREKEVES